MYEDEANSRKLRLAMNSPIPQESFLIGQVNITSARVLAIQAFDFSDSTQKTGASRAFAQVFLDSRSFHWIKGVNGV
jgi:hypothetical protein